MHELAIADAIVRIAEQHARGRRVTKVEVLVGHLRQVVPSSLAFSFQLLTEGTCLDGAELAIEEVPAEGRCRDCGTVTTLAGFPLTCGGCDGLDLEVLKGEELLVDSLEIDDEPALTTTGGMVHGDH
ncbi:MAG: hydrogenase nickel incorporation protein HypA/HybF [Solirubrobacteraceae bacterium]|jgi:hydrogenase nickel incorporation protein HypA/HybF|nr:hydrogenase nickel incorporation protein HypA/HybF [Solirubrobacteraceae bacterium]